LAGTLYVVSTPIGNLNDISQRAIDILNNVDYIAAEDTRHTKKLLNFYNIESDILSYHEWNELQRCKKIKQDVSNGQTVALVTDSGTPCISDPGFRIVRFFKKENLDVKSIPGPSAVISALSVSGLPTDSYYFEGFLPKKKGRKSKYDFFLTLDCSIILYESPFRINKTLAEIHSYLGNRTVSVCRELTKKFEEVRTDFVADLIIEFNEKNHKGEFVIIISKEGFEL